jgi:hypothetical protein
MSYEDYRRARQRREGYARRYRTEDTNIFGEKSLLIAILRGMTERRQARARKMHPGPDAALNQAINQGVNQGMNQVIDQMNRSVATWTTQREHARQETIAAGAAQARRLAEQTIEDCEQALSAEFTGIGADGGLHYRVTYIKRDGEIATAGISGYQK